MRQPTITIVQRGKADRFGRLRLYLSYAFNYKTNYISLGWKVKPAEWIKNEQKVAGKVLSGGANAARINADLLNTMSKAYETIAEIQAQNRFPAFEEFEKMFIGDAPAKKMQEQNFSDLALTVLKKEFEAMQISRATKESYEVAVRKFEKIIGRVPFNGITRMTILAFKGDLSKSYNPNLASQYTRNLKIVYNRIAKNFNLTDSKPFDSITYDFERMSPKKEMSKEEFETLYEQFKTMPETSKHFETLRRFLFMCLGLRFSDTNLIEKSHLIEFEDAGQTYLAISKPSQKTKGAGILPILPESQEWLLKWRENGFLFDQVSYDTYYDRLKRVTKMILGRELTTHYGRHFAGDFIINTDTLDMEDVKAVLGISSPAVAEIYAKRKIKNTVRKYYEAVANKDTKKT